MRTLLTILVAAAFIFSSCKKSASSPPGSEFSELVNYGEIPYVSQPTPHQMIYYNSQIFAGTDDGIWKIDLITKTWSRGGLDGKHITGIYSHPDIAGRLYAATRSTSATDKSLYISNNSGANWEPVTAPIFDNANQLYETYYDIKIRPGFPNQLYAKVEGITIAVSKEGGQTWNRQNYETSSTFAFNGFINFLQNNPNEIIQGAETPLDHSWLAKYHIDESDPVKLGSYQRIIGDNLEWSNKRPNCIKTFPSNPSVLYVGMEGSLAKVEGTQWQYLYEGGKEPDRFPYTYIKGIWLDPGNSRHLIFGGGVNGLNTSLSLYETHDEGATIDQLNDPFGMEDPEIISIVSCDPYPALLVNINGASRKARLLIYK
ncbi:MAG TPA: hypothetical protein VF008_30540 [Niastella sp.]